MPEHNLVCLIGQLGLGGTERQLFLFLSSLDKARWKPLVVTVGADGEWKERIEALGVPVVSMAGTHTLLKPLYFRWLVARHRPELIYSWSFYANFFRFFAGPARFLGSLRNELKTEKADLSPFRFKRCLDCPRLVVNSPQLLQNLLDEGVPKEKIVYIRNIFAADGVIATTDRQRLRAQVRAQYQIPADAILVAGGGRDAPWKNFPFFIDSFAAAKRPELRALLVGAGPLRHADYIKGKGLADNIVLTGVVPDAKPLLAAADLFFLSSDAEGMPNIVIEAMAAGCAVVATDVGGVREILGEGSNAAGVIVPPGNPEAATWLAQLAADPAAREDFARKGAERIKLFSPAGIMPDYLRAMEA